MAVVVTLAALGVSAVLAAVIDDFSGATLDDGRWRRRGPTLFTTGAHHLQFPCKDRASEMLILATALGPGFYQLAFQDYRSTNTSPSGRGQGSVVALGLSADDQRVRTIRGDVGQGGYFEANHFTGQTYRVWYHDTREAAGRLGLYDDGARVQMLYRPGASEAAAWIKVGPTLQPMWSAPPRLYLSVHAGGSGCTGVTITSVEHEPLPGPQAVRAVLDP